MIGSILRYCRRSTGLADVMSVGSVEWRIVTGKREDGDVSDGRRRRHWKMARGACVAGVRMSLSPSQQKFPSVNVEYCVPCPYEI